MEEQFSQSTKLSTKQISGIVTICKDYDIQKMSLFGSVLDKKSNILNDVDILIDPPTQFGLFDLIRLQRELEEYLKLKVDLVTRRGIHPDIYADILDSMVTIYS